MNHRPFGIAKLRNMKTGVRIRAPKSVVILLSIKENREVIIYRSISEIR